MSARLLLVDPGLASSLQDFGRVGLQRFGTPPAGALDRDALRLANALVGARADQAALEARYLGPTIEAAADSVRIALVGADVAMKLTPADPMAEPAEIGPNRTVTLKRGDRLRVGPLRGSSTAYLAVEGGFAAAPTLGSRSFFARGPFGGFYGRPLAAGDALPLALMSAAEGGERALTRSYPIVQPERIRVVLGPQDDYFTEAGLETFFATDWRTSKDGDRMGLRLEGPVIEHAKGFNIVSDGSATGAIQVPGTGLPLVLLPDRGTAGGYPKIATVITPDLGALGRLGPGEHLRFAPVSAAEGVAAARARRAEIDAMIAAIAPYRDGAALDLDRLYEGNLVTGLVDEAVEEQR